MEVHPLTTSPGWASMRSRCVDTTQRRLLFRPTPGKSMGHQGKCVCTAFASLGLFACSAAGTWMAVANLPGIFEPPPELDEGDPTVTWLGQGVAAAFGLCFLLLVVIYAGKRWITLFARSVPEAMCWYCLGVACSLPFIWFMLVLDWQNPFVYRFSCWVYDPIGVWAVPTASFAWDVTRRPPCSCEVYLLRSVIEIVAVIPIWLVSWVFVSFFFLGGGWI